MTALILARSLIARGRRDHAARVPERAGIIGVGEGSTPWLRGFFDSLGIEESEWMPACHATYKCGITFDGWSTKPGFERYFHPFASMLDNLTMRSSCTTSRHGSTASTCTRTRTASSSPHVSRHSAVRPRRAENFPFDVWHGYHFDAVLLGQFLHTKALERGVRYHSCHVTHATLDRGGRDRRRAARRRASASPRTCSSTAAASRAC